MAYKFRNSVTGEVIILDGTSAAEAAYGLSGDFVYVGEVLN